MWSFGCILIELYVGIPLFAGEDEMEQLAIIMKYIGEPPIKLIKVYSNIGRHPIRSLF